MMIFILLCTPPTLDQAHPTRAQGEAVVRYYESEVAHFAANDPEGLDELIINLSLELHAWGEKYDASRTRRLRKCLEILTTIRAIDNAPKRRAA